MPGTEPVFVYPLLGADDSWSGYRIEFATTAPDSETLFRLFSSPRLDTFDQRHPWFLPAVSGGYDAGTLTGRSVTVFPAHPKPEDTEALSQLEAALRAQGRQLGLKASPEHKLPSPGGWDCLLVDCGHARSLPPYTLIGMASRTKLVATNVHTHNDRNWILSNACILSTCEFLQTRSAPNTKADITRLKLLKLLTLIADDADTDCLDSIFREEPKLAYSLLRLVNSAALSPGSPITSFNQAINLLGRRQLQRWLQLLVFSDPNNGQHPNPLLQKAAARGHLFEFLAGQLTPPSSVENLADSAFMVGTFSLLDVLLGMSMPEIMRQLPLPEVTRTALLEHKGSLGELLAAVTAIDKHDLNTASARLAALGIDADNFFEAQLEGYGWASKIHTT
ncbi:EAL and HDOD domain-containing protein [Dechloromonas sp. HYN0024]|uniref:EAL and HDOD domain-containing protein n=1 Tax=Dechloromonas sp. HYN0024 TaxID=2231055 RepID=UPI000E443E9B|nr:HDOD domain-containing protein [Dechloromonas sp. HYN0024]AXS79236.1 HDOD domain-containing protein [Dechloromonas sp. HYN0024]